MIKCVTFDLDDTLWAVDPVIETANHTLYEWLSENAPLFTKAYKLEEFDKLRQETEQAHPERAHSVSQIRFKLLENGLRNAGYSAEQALLMAEDAFNIYYDARQQVTFFEHATSMLKDLKSAGYQVGALTNGNADTEHVGLGDYFDFQFNPDIVGAKKPDPLIFDHMLHFTGLRPEQVVHIGDCPVNDVRGARDAGVWTIWVNLKGIDWPDGEENRPDYEVMCLSQIPQMLKQIEARTQSRVAM